jgi:trimethylamine:corrinoid methyltransferase-like protein
MSLNYEYPTYNIDLTPEMLDQCCDVGVRLLRELGLGVSNEKFLDAIRKKEGVRVEGGRVYFEEILVRKNIEKFVAGQKKNLKKKEEKSSAPRSVDIWEAGLSPREKAEIPEEEWTLRGGGFSMAVIDVETDAVRPATCRDLRDLIRLVTSYGIEGNYPVIPQDVPPIMQAIAVFKISWETSDRIRCLDYMDKRQTRPIYEMHRVMEKPFALFLTVESPMTVSESDLNIFLDFYPDWKRHRDIEFSVLDYPMLGISKPITITGNIAQYIAEEFGVYTLLNLFDPEIEVPVAIPGGRPTDLRNTCWAWGHPRQHLFDFLNARILPRLCKLEAARYLRDGTLLETSSCAVDEQAGLEKMATAMVAALQGARNFGGLGNLCVDDLFSGVQFVIDVEIVEYVREVVEAFNPHPDIVSMDGIFETLQDVSLGKEHFLAHPDTAAKFRNILPSSDLLHREKLRSWLGHKKLLKDRAREECLKRIENQPPFSLPSEKQKELDEIYKRAEAELVK